jgi:hypothetical protein
MDLGVIQIMIETLLGVAVFQYLIGIFLDGLPKTDF